MILKIKRGIINTDKMKTKIWLIFILLMSFNFIIAENNESCKPNWQCTEWYPERCPQTNTQTKNCTDINNCGVITNKPPEIKLCTFEKDYAWIIYVIITFLIFLILIVFMMILKVIKTQSPTRIIQPKPVKPYYKPVQ